MVFCEENQQQKGGARSDFLVTVILLYTFACVFMNKEESAQTSHLMLIFCMSWRDLGRCTGEIIKFFFASLSFLQLVLSNMLLLQ